MLTRKAAHETVDIAAQMDALTHLAAHWGYCFHDDSSWDNSADAMQAMHEFVNCAAEDMQGHYTSDKNHKESDQTGLTAWVAYKDGVQS